MPLLKTYDVVIIGAGAAGMMAAIECGKRGRRTALIDHAKKPGEKIRISGGGRCNFTNLDCNPSAYLSENKHFCKSALRQYSQHDFIRMVERHGISYHEKTLGQLFCDNSAKDIIQMLLNECEQYGVDLFLQTSVNSTAFDNNLYNLETTAGPTVCDSLIIATGALSIPKMGATGFAYDIARQFGHSIVPTKAGLVPFTFDGDRLEAFKGLAGVSLDCRTSVGKQSFNEAMLFTHRGLSGPAVLQISSYLDGESDVCFDLLPEQQAYDVLRSAKQQQAKTNV